MKVPACLGKLGLLKVHVAGRHHQTCWDCLERRGTVESAGRISAAVGQAAVTVPVTSFQVAKRTVIRGGIPRCRGDDDDGLVEVRRYPTERGQKPLRMPC
jgi:hypothetical protein